MDRLPGALAGQGGRPDRTRIVALTHQQADLTDRAWADRVDLSDVDLIVNAAAYTQVDAAETPDGRREAWAVNVAGVARLVELCRDRRIPLVHVSSDYVFDGRLEEHDEGEPFSPLGVYGQTKAAGDAIVATLPHHYLVRTSWVVGDGPNFVATMARLADSGARPSVVDDQYGRLTFTTDLADAIGHLIATGAPHGTYHVTNGGPVTSWADLAADVFELRGRDRNDVTRVSTAEYEAQQRAAGKNLAARPRRSSLSLAKITASGFSPPPAADRLRATLR